MTTTRQNFDSSSPTNSSDHKSSPVSDISTMLYGGYLAYRDNILVLGPLLTKLCNLETHSLTQICWKKCVPGAVKGSKLDKSEEGCLANCVDRFLDINFLTMKYLNGNRS